MMRAVWNGAVLAEAPQTVHLEGNHYFPATSLARQYFTESTGKSLCLWKGMARYYTITVDGRINRNAAWYYPHPSPLARRIKNHVAFWNGVQVEGEPAASVDSLPMWRIGVTGGAVGILCCAGPTVLALLGIVSAATAYSWANTLYDNYTWWFRLGGLTVLAVLVWAALRKRNQCNLAGMRRWRWRLMGTLVIAVGTYIGLYLLTTWLGTFA